MEQQQEVIDMRYPKESGLTALASAPTPMDSGTYFITQALLDDIRASVVPCAAGTNDDAPAGGGA